MPKEHVIQDGECILSVADTAKVSKYHTIWDDPLNAELKKTRPNPNALVVGDKVQIPDPKEKTVGAPTGATKTVTVKKKEPPSLHIVLVGAEDKPLKDKAWAMTEPVVAKGTTGADGLIKVAALDVGAKKGALTIVIHPPPKPPGPPPKKEKPKPSYPPAVDPDEYKDAKVPDLPKDLETLELTLKIGSLPSHNHESGVKARLYNLGFLQAADPKPDVLLDAVKRYQRSLLSQKEGSGKAADIQDDLKNRHDKK
ncbi:MAG TPA: hypothetical protein VIG99_29705 [Myxococcaceae bacterium]|jgi:hypothetical protein